MAVDPLSHPLNHNQSKASLNSTFIKQSIEINNNSNNKVNENIDLSSAKDPLKLVYQAAIDDLNQRLEPFLGKNALQRGMDSGIDVSPEATAERIVTQVTSLMPRFRDSNPELNDQQAGEKFVSIIRQGVQQGFDEARDILQGLQVLEGEIASNIEETFTLVQQGLDEFLRQYSNKSSNEEMSQEQPVPTDKGKPTSL